MFIAYYVLKFRVQSQEVCAKRYSTPLPTQHSHPAKLETFMPFAGLGSWRGPRKAKQ